MKRYLWIFALSAACSLGGKRPSYQYYVIAPTRPAPTQPPPTTNERSLAVDEVTIPGYLEREQIATRTAGHQVVYSSTDRWAEPLDQAFERALREDLASQLASTGIAVHSRGGVPTYELRVDVQRFERTGVNQIELWAHWVLRSTDGVVDSGETRVRVAMPGTDSNAMAAALSDAIGRMAIDVADRVKSADAVATRDRHRHEP